MILWPKTSKADKRLLRNWQNIDGENMRLKKNKNFENRIKLAKKHFESYFESLQRSFQKQNRLSQEIIRYLLELTGDNKRVDSILIKLIFGKDEMQVFQVRGVKDSMPNQKVKLRLFIREYLREEDLKYDASISIFEKDTTEDDKILRKVNFQIKNEIKKQCGKNKNIIKEQFNLNKVIKRKVEERRRKEQEDINRLDFILTDLEIPKKYMDHLLWLKNNAPNSEFISDFVNLLLAVYGENLEINESYNPQDLFLPKLSKQ